MTEGARVIEDSVSEETKITPLSSANENISNFDSLFNNFIDSLELKDLIIMILSIIIISLISYFVYIFINIYESTVLLYYNNLNLNYQNKLIYELPNLTNQISIF